MPLSSYTGSKNGRPKLAILAPQGWSVRNWILSDFLPTLSSAADVIVLTPQAATLREQIDVPGVSFEPMQVEPLKPLAKNLATSLEFAHFYKQQTYIHRSILSRSYQGWPWHSRLRLSLLKFSARRIFKRLNSRQLARIEQSCFGLMAESKRLEELFRRERVDLVFSTMPLIAYYERPALWAAERLALRTACAITSWDNFSSKSRLPIRFSHYLVWGELMRDDLLLHYPDTPHNSISITGSPQFDYYRRPEMLMGRSRFIESIGGDPSRPLILWSGVSQNQMPNEPVLLELFCQAVRDGKVSGRPQILVRPHPIGGGARYHQLRERYPEVLFTETNATDPNYLINWLPLHDYVIQLVNSLAYCDVNINHCSTMTLDACALNRPVVNLAFDLKSSSLQEQQVRNCYLFDHYRSVVESGAIRIANNLDELIRYVNEYLDNPALDDEARARLLRLQCGEVDGGAARRAAHCLLELMCSPLDVPLMSEVGV